MKLILKKIFNEMLYPIALYSRQIAGTLAILFLARYLPVYDYGLFSSYKTIAAFGLLLANLGFNEYIVVSSQNIASEAKCKVTLFLLNALCIIGLITLLSFFSNVEFKLLFFLTLLRTFFDSVFFLLILPYFQASKNFKTISYFNIFYAIMIVIITTVSYVLKLSLLKFLILSVLLGIINFVQASMYIKIDYWDAIKNIGKLVKKIDKSIYIYMGVLLCSYLYGQIPSLYISLMVPKEQAALFFAAFTIASIIGLLLSAQNQKIIPEMINASVDKIKKIIKFNLKLMMSINALILLFFIFLGKFLLKLIYSNSYYINSYNCLILLTIANIFIAIAAIYGAYITASGNQRIKIKMQIEAIIICVVTLLLFYRFGIYAATLAYLLSATHIGIRYVIKTKQLLKLQEE